MLWSFVFSAGFFSAAPSLLPSTFAMYGVMLGSAIAMAPADGSYRRIVLSGLAFAAAVIVGWPFVIIMAVPVVLEQLFIRGTKEDVSAGQSAAWAANRAQNLAVALICGALILVSCDVLQARKLVQSRI
jgi:alpha-1,2-mannosyltransferase